MRIIRMLFIVLMAAALIVLAFANRGMVTVRALPASLESWFGGGWSANVPLFVLIFVAVLAGVVLGLIWEWLREAQLRNESARRARDIAELEREVGTLRNRNIQPRDDVLAIVDNAAAARPGQGASVPARR